MSLLADRFDPSEAPARWRSDAEFSLAIRRIWEGNFQVYGVQEVGRQLQREDVDVALCTVAHLMRRMGVRGVIPGKVVRTAISDQAAPCLLDRVNRHRKQQ